MMLRVPPEFQRVLAQLGQITGAPYATPPLRGMVTHAKGVTFRLVDLLSCRKAPSCDGQQASPLVLLPFNLGYLAVFRIRREPNRLGSVIASKYIEKGRRAWGQLKSFLHLLQQQALRRAVIPFHSKQPSAQLLGQGPQPLQGAQSCKARPLAQRALLSLARPSWSTATNLISGAALRPTSALQHPVGVTPVGCFAFSTSLSQLRRA